MDVCGKKQYVFYWQKMYPNKKAGNKLQEKENWNGYELQKDLDFLVG